MVKHQISNKDGPAKGKAAASKTIPNGEKTKISTKSKVIKKTKKNESQVPQIKKELKVAESAKENGAIAQLDAIKKEAQSPVQNQDSENGQNLNSRPARNIIPKFDDYDALSFTQQPKKKSKSTSKDAKNGWYRVDRIEGHKIERVGKKIRLFLEIKWEGYEETTFEEFGQFAKDTLPLVEKYIRKNLIGKIDQQQQEIKDLRYALTAKREREDYSSGKFGQSSRSLLGEAQLEKLANVQARTSSTSGLVNSNENQGSDDTVSERSELSKKQAILQAEQEKRVEMLQQDEILALLHYYLDEERRKKEWKHVLLNILNKKIRDDDGNICHMVKATNSNSDDYVNVKIREDWLEEQNHREIENLLRPQVNLAKKDVVFYYVISEKRLKASNPVI